MRRPLRVAALASVVLLISWAPPTTDGPLVPIDDELVPSVVSAPPGEPSTAWSAAAMSEEGQCYWITDSPAPGGGVVHGAEHSGESCHHDHDPARSKPAW